MGTKIQRSKENRHRKNQTFEKNGYTESSQQTHNKYKDTFGIKDITLSNKQKDFQDVLRDNILTFVEGTYQVRQSFGEWVKYSMPTKKSARFLQSQRTGMGDGI